MTCKQAQSDNAQVRRGEKGTLAILIRDDSDKLLLDRRQQAQPQGRAGHPKVSTAVVFNAEQIRGMLELEPVSVPCRCGRYV
jgi:antirestriction protein ArdC